jgi:hypothetical protein
MKATRKKAAGRKRPAAKRMPKRSAKRPAKRPAKRKGVETTPRTIALAPMFKITKIGEATDPKGIVFWIEDRRTGKRISRHKTFPAAWARRLKLFKAERIGGPVYTAEDHD